MKTINWSEFIASLQDDGLVTKIDGMDKVTINLVDVGEQVVISWMDSIEDSYTFAFDKKDNEKIPVRENELLLRCNEEDVDPFTFSFYSIAKHIF